MNGQAHIYWTLMEWRMNDPSVDSYCERHHIIPRCFGGDDSKENVVRLGVSEHVYAHTLLPSMYQGKQRAKMAFALWRMIHGRQGAIINMTLEERDAYAAEHRRACSIRTTGRKHRDETRAKMSASSMGRPNNLSNDARGKLADAAKARFSGKPKSDEHREKIASALTGKPRENRHNRDPEKIRKTADKHRGMKRSAEARAKMSESAKGRVPWNKGITKNTSRMNMKSSPNEDLSVLVDSLRE